MRVVFAGENIVGVVSLLTCRMNSVVMGVVSSDKSVIDVAGVYGIPVFNCLSDLESSNVLNDYLDLFVSVHCREFITQKLLSHFEFKGINIHPCLSKYPGADPIGRLLKDKELNASVGCHLLTDQIDGGKVLYEKHLLLPEGLKSRVEVYNILYPVYVMVLSRVLQVFQARGSMNWESLR